MSTTVWKYPLKVQDSQRIKVPFGAQFLCVQVQRGQPCLWAKVDPFAAPAEMEVLIHGTGHDTGDTDDTRYVGTFQLGDGAFVGHVWIGLA